MRSLSIGSPLLSTIRKGDYHFSLMASKLPLTLPEIAALSVLSPRGWKEVTTQPCAFVAMVSVCPLAAIPAGFLIRTTFSIWDGKRLSPLLTEFLHLLASQLFEVEQLLNKSMVTKRRGPVSAVSTLPATMQRDRTGKRGRSFGGSPVDLSLG